MIDYEATYWCFTWPPGSTLSPVVFWTRLLGVRYFPELHETKLAAHEHLAVRLGLPEREHDRRGWKWSQR